MNMYIMPECPYCKSNNTGEVRPTEAFTISGENEIKRINGKQGKKIYFTDIDNYKFLKSLGLNYYCFNCNREFRGESEKKELTDKEKDDYLKSIGLSVDKFKKKFSLNPFKWFI